MKSLKNIIKKITEFLYSLKDLYFAILIVVFGILIFGFMYNGLYPYYNNPKVEDSIFILTFLLFGLTLISVSNNFAKYNHNQKSYHKISRDFLLGISALFFSYFARITSPDTTIVSLALFLFLYGVFMFCFSFLRLLVLESKTLKEIFYGNK